MKTEEIDRIIAEALEAEKNKGNGRKRKGKALSTHSGNTVQRIRNILNVVFIIGFVAAVIIYFALPDQRLLFFSVGFGAMLLKIVEFFLRFLF